MHAVPQKFEKQKFSTTPAKDLKTSNAQTKSAILDKKREEELRKSEIDTLPFRISYNRQNTGSY